MKKPIDYAVSEYALNQLTGLYNTPIGVVGAGNQFCPGITIRNVYVEFETGQILDPSATEFDDRKHFCALVIS